jgi:hypothetical protein
MMGQLGTLSSSQIIFIPLFSAHRSCAFYQPKTVKFCWGKTISSAKPAYIDFSSSNFAVEGHILTTAGDALTKEHAALNFELTRSNGFWNLWELDCTMYIGLKSTHRSESMFCCIFTNLTPPASPPTQHSPGQHAGWMVCEQEILSHVFLSHSLPQWLVSHVPTIHGPQWTSTDHCTIHWMLSW